MSCIYDPRDHIRHKEGNYENCGKYWYLGVTNEPIIKYSIFHRVINFLKRFGIMFYLILAVSCCVLLLLTGAGYMILPSLLLGILVGFILIKINR